MYKWVPGNGYLDAGVLGAGWAAMSEQSGDERAAFRAASRAMGERDEPAGSRRGLCGDEQGDMGRRGLRGSEQGDVARRETIQLGLNPPRLLYPLRALGDCCGAKWRDSRP